MSFLSVSICSSSQHFEIYMYLANCTVTGDDTLQRRNKSALGFLRVCKIVALRSNLERLGSWSRHVW
jgi:hypothetical protein